MLSTHWKVLSVWSKAGVGTSIVLELRPPPPPRPSLQSPSAIETASAGKLDGALQSSKQTKKSSFPRLVFDMGATPIFDDAIPAKYVFLTHGHVDHIGAVFSHARAHAVSFGGYVNCLLWALSMTFFFIYSLFTFDLFSFFGQIDQCLHISSLPPYFPIWNNAEMPCLS